jgi:hypothetical protein
MGREVSVWGLVVLAVRYKKCSAKHQRGQTRFWHSHGLAFGMAFHGVTLAAFTASCMVVRHDCSVLYQCVRIKPLKSYFSAYYISRAHKRERSHNPPGDGVEQIWVDTFKTGASAHLSRVRVHQPLVARTTSTLQIITSGSLSMTLC